MKKIIFLISLIFLISQKTNAEFLIDYHRWLTENKQTQFLNKEGKLKKWLLDDYDKGKLGERFKWKSNPSLERLHYQVFHFKKQQSLGEL